MRPGPKAKGCIRWVVSRENWRLDLGGKFCGQFKTKEEALLALKPLLKAREDEAAAEIQKTHGNVELKQCYRCKVQKPLSEFTLRTVKSTGVTKRSVKCILCAAKARVDMAKPERVSAAKEYRKRPDRKEADRLQNQKLEGKVQRAMLQKTPEYKKKRKDCPPPCMRNPEKQRQYRSTYEASPKYAARVSSLQFRLKQSLMAKMRNAFKGVQHRPDDLSKLQDVCPWAVHIAEDGTLDCTELIRHFDLRRLPGMTLDNYGSFWSIGHRIPSVYFDASNADDWKRCNSAANLMCDYVVAVSDSDQKSNSEKGSKLPTSQEMLQQGADSWPLIWKERLPSSIERLRMEKEAHSGQMTKERMHSV